LASNLSAFEPASVMEFGFNWQVVVNCAVGSVACNLCICSAAAVV